jgi:GntR family transcriptional repressor for pyruvate dehydrogenase complex
MPDADRVTHTSRHLEQAILSGKLAPGDLLPSEREISSEMGVSRSVVREALGRLASLGLVRSVHGSGTRVEAPNNKPITTGYQILLRRSEVRLAEVAAVRLPLETAIAAEAALRRTDEHIARLVAAQTALASPRGTLEAHVNADLEFHAILAEATGNPLFGIVLTPIQELLIETRRRTLGRHGAALAHEHHDRILEAVRQGDAPAAGEAMRAHLEANYQHLTADSSSGQ